VRQESASAQKQWAQSRESDATHTDIQGALRDLGKSLGYDVWIASNDRGRSFGSGFLGDGCMTQLPDAALQTDSVRLIDVVWVEKNAMKVAAAFEVEHSTSIYSGIVRMLDLALGSQLGGGSVLFLVAPDSRRDEVAQQLRRPAFSRVSELGIRYLSYGQLVEHQHAMARFGSGIKPLLEISQVL
jgi:type II restriction enzyme